MNVTGNAIAVKWLNFGTPDSWEAYVVPAGEAAPDMNTEPTHTDLTSPGSSVLDNLLPGSPYAIYLRSRCGDTFSEWFGPLETSTDFDCSWAIPIDDDCLGFEAIYEGVHGFENTNCPLFYEHRQLFVFTPSFSGDYYLYGESAQIPWASGYWANTMDGCTPEQWQCFQYDPEYGQPYLPDLIEGNSYYLLLLAHPDGQQAPSYRLSNGPKVDLEFAPLLQGGPFQTNVRIPVTEAFEDNLFDYYIDLPGDTPPTRLSNPTLGMQSLTNQWDTLVGITEPATSYQFYFRIASSGEPYCWEPAQLFMTDPYCGDVQEVFFSNQSALSTRLQALVAPDNYPIVAYDLAPFDPANALSQGGGILENDTLTRILSNLMPESDYEVFIKTQCPDIVYPSLQPWQGPYEFSTTDDCFAIATPIYCQQNNLNTFPSDDEVNFTLDDYCPFNPGNLGTENLYSFYALESGTRFIDSELIFGDNQASYLIKDAASGCNYDDWEELGCWGDQAGNDYPALYFDVEVGHTYYIKVQAYDVHTPGPDPLFQSFQIAGCDNPCGLLSNIIFDGEQLSWIAAGSESSWDLYYDLSTGYFNEYTTEPLLTVSQPNAIIEDLTAGQSYTFRIRANCGNGNHGDWVSFEYIDQSAPIAAIEGTLTRCHPVAPLPNPFEMEEYPYEIIHFKPSESGEYTIAAPPAPIAGRWAMLLYEGAIELADPYAEVFPLGVDATIITTFLEAGQNYWLYCFPRFDYTITNDVTYTIEFFGPAPLESAPIAVFDGQADDQKGIVALGDEMPTEPYVCLDTAGWMHFYDVGLDENTAYDDRLWFSVAYYPELGDFPELIVSGEEVSLLTNPPADYIQNSSGWYTMNRHWNMIIGPGQQPTGPILVRFYFTNEDFEAVQDAINAIGGTVPESFTDLIFYKINNDDVTSYNPDPSEGHVGIPEASSYDAPGYWEYQNGDVASTENWRLGYHTDGSPYAEYVIRYFSGGGGGSAANGDGALTYIKELSTASNWQAYPNPVTDVVFFKPTNASFLLPEQYSVFNAAGQLVDSGAYTQKGISLSHLETGVYLVKIGSEAGWQVFRLVKV